MVAQCGEKQFFFLPTPFWLQISHDSGRGGGEAASGRRGEAGALARGGAGERASSVCVHISHLWMLCRVDSSRSKALRAFSFCLSHPRTDAHIHA